MFKKTMAAAMLAAVSAMAAAVPEMFFADLDGLSEFPPNPSPGIGHTTVTIDAALHTMRVEVLFHDLTSITNAAHIHVINGPGDTNTTDSVGPVATPTPAFPGFPLGVTAGFMDMTYDMTQAANYRAGWITACGGTVALAELELFNGIREGRAYLNIHTTIYPGGEIRGFLEPVPEPASMIALALGAGVLAARRRKRS